MWEDGGHWHWTRPAPSTPRTATEVRVGKPGPPPALPPSFAPTLSPAQRHTAQPSPWRNWRGPPHPSLHLNPPHSVFDGCGRGCHFLVHHGPKLLLTHIQALWLQHLGEEGTHVTQAGFDLQQPHKSLGTRLGQQVLGLCAVFLPVSGICRLCTQPPVQPKLEGSAEFGDPCLTPAPLPPMISARTVHLTWPS